MIGPDDDDESSAIPFPGRGENEDGGDVGPMSGVALALKPRNNPEPTVADLPMGKVVPLRPVGDSAIEPETAGERDIEAPPTKRRPPLLASELLAEDLAPTHPYQTSSRSLYAATGVAAFAILGLGGWSFTLAMVALFVLGVGVAAALPLTYRTRSLACLVLGLGGLVTSITSPGGPGLLVGLASGATTLLSAGLFLRHAHRAALSGRLLVLVGIVAGAAWLALSSRDQPLHTVGTEWHSWAPAALKVLFFVVGLLSLLAFMDSSTHAGCAVWGALALLWITGAVATEVSIALALGLTTASDGWAGLTVAQAPLVAATGMALSQVLADLPHRQAITKPPSPSHDEQKVARKTLPS